MTSLRPWLLPTLVGPFVTMWSLTTILFLVGAQLHLFGERLDSWAIAMLLTGFVSAGLVVSLLVADVLLLAMKLRRLPMNGQAWVSSLACPLCMYGLLAFTPPIDSIAVFVAWIGACLVGSALGIRYLTGTRPTAS